MARHRFALVFLAVLCLLTSRASAVEPYLEFVEQLRDREYFDTALEYLEAIEGRQDLPEDVKALIPFEKAETLILLAKVQRNPDAANATLSRAQAFLEQFLKANPDHPKAAKANSDAANVLVGKGKVAVLQARSPSNAHKRKDYLATAQASFDSARKLFQDAAVKYQKLYEKFPVFIEPGKDAAQFEAKANTERMKIRADLDVAIVEYEQAQAYEKDDPKYQSTLKDAAAKFETIHAKHRSQVAGLYARMYQGKCFEEQGDLQKALGLYSELLSHNPDSNVMKNLQAQVTHFKLICLNSEKKGDHVLVDKLAQEWIKANPGMIRTRNGTGIRFEQARALEMASRPRDVAEGDKKKMLAEALSIARMVNRTGGEYRDASQAMITRLMAALNRDGKDPADFDTAYGMARDLVNKIKENKDLVKGAKDPEEAKRYQKALEAHLEETARILNLALALRKADSKIKEVNTCRYSLSYVYYEQRRSYDSAVLAEYVARRYAKDEESEALPSEAAYLAMAAYAQAYNFRANTDKQTDIQRVISSSDFIVATWPGTPKAIEALEMLGKMYLQIKDYPKAAETFEKVPPDSATYLDVQLMLGQTLWEAAIEGFNRPEAERPPAAKLNEYQVKAQDVLRKVIAAREPKLAENEPLPDNLAMAKLTLAQIANQTTQYPEAAIAVAEGQPRPPSGVKSGRFAQEVYKQILRTYIGLQNLEKARKAMSELEKIAAGQGQDILPIYVALGKQFKEELDRLAKSNPDQHKSVLKSFESFLANMLARKDGQTYNSLAWIGAMYVSLGEGTADKAEAAKYFKAGSTAYDELMTKATADPAFCTEQQLLAAKAQLVACKRKAGEFESAVEMITELLKQRKNAIDTQTEACYIYQDWAAAGKAESQAKWAVALSGDRALREEKAKPIGMWGWGDLAKRLAQSAESAKFADQVLDARYNIAFCRFKAAEGMPDNKKKEAMGRAVSEIQRTAMMTILDDEQYKKFNGLHREVLTAMGQTPVDVVRSAPAADVAAAKSEEAKEAAEERKQREQELADRKKKKQQKAKATALANSEKAKKSESSTMYLAIGVLVVFLGGGGIWYYLKGNKPKHSLLADGDGVDLPNIVLAPAPAPVKKAAKANPAAAAGITTATATASPKAKPPAKPPGKPKA